RVTYNDAETVKKFSGLTQPGIMPPENSDAGRTYKQNFQKKYGIDPYASKGFIPNFQSIPQKIDASNFATMLVPEGAAGTGQYTFLDKKKQPLAQVTWPIVPLAKQYKDNSVMTNIYSKVEDVAEQLMIGYASTIQPPARNFKPGEIAAKINQAGGAKGSLSSFAGAVFEAGTNLALDYQAARKEGLDSISRL
ncbi:hypothetical protein EBR77_04405, partial [bacterium]|nr:hypothetical protein [bacterium]